jgi:NAD(P)-dependent dehydrogenase (short-subunit alcohol dehydrogenase family)
MPTNAFEDAVAIVTGGASGIGRCLAEQLMAAGARVVIADIDFEKAQQVASSLSSAEKRIEAVALDVARVADVESTVNAIVERHGRLDYMFNNAAVAVAGEFRDLLPEHFRRVLDVNVMGVVHGSMAAYRIMLRQRAGHIVNVSSMTGLLPTPMLSAYSTSKHAIVGLSTALRIEAKWLGVNVSVACPGLVDTTIHERTDYLSARKEDFLAQLPRNLMVSPDAAARAILRGVARNEAIIVHPWYVKIGWWLHRLSPALMSSLMQHSLTRFRKVRVEK